MNENPLPFILLKRESEKNFSVIYFNDAATSFFAQFK